MTLGEKLLNFSRKFDTIDMTAIEIAKAIGHQNAESVRRTLYQNGIPFKLNNGGWEHRTTIKDILVAMDTEKMTIREIAAVTGKTECGVRSYMARYKLPYKKRSSNGKISTGTVADRIKKLGDVSGMTAREIADTIGKSYRSVIQALHNAQIEYKRIDNHTRIRRLRKMDTFGMTIDEIAASLGGDQTFLKRALDRYDIPYLREPETVDEILDNIMPPTQPPKNLNFRGLRV